MHYQSKKKRYQSFLRNIISKYFLIFNWIDCPYLLALLIKWSYFCKIIQKFTENYYPRLEQFINHQISNIHFFIFITFGFYFDQTAYFPFLIYFKVQVKVSFTFQLTSSPIYYDRNNGLYLHQSLFEFQLPLAKWNILGKS